MAVYACPSYSEIHFIHINNDFVCVSFFFHAVLFSAEIAKLKIHSVYFVIILVTPYLFFLLIQFFFISYSMILWATLTMTFVIWDLVSTKFTFVDVFLTIDPAESSIRKPNTMSIMSRVKSFHFYILLWPLINNTLQKALIMHRYGQMGIGCVSTKTLQQHQCGYNDFLLFSHFPFDAFSTLHFVTTHRILSVSMLKFSSELFFNNNRPFNRKECFKQHKSQLVVI